MSLPTARRAGLGPLTTTPEGVAILHDDSSILPSSGQACGSTKNHSTLNPQPSTTLMNTPHPYDLVIPDSESGLG
jgi:hypothetical protein